MGGNCGERSRGQVLINMLKRRSAFQDLLRDRGSSWRYRYRAEGVGPLRGRIGNGTDSQD